MGQPLTCDLARLPAPRAPRPGCFSHCSVANPTTTVWGAELLWGSFLCPRRVGRSSLAPGVDGHGALTPLRTCLLSPQGDLPPGRSCSPAGRQSGAARGLPARRERRGCRCRVLSPPCVPAEGAGSAARAVPGDWWGGTESLGPRLPVSAPRGWGPSQVSSTSFVPTAPGSLPASPRRLPLASATPHLASADRARCLSSPRRRRRLSVPPPGRAPPALPPPDGTGVPPPQGLPGRGGHIKDPALHRPGTLSPSSVLSFCSLPCVPRTGWWLRSHSRL